MEKILTGILSGVDGVEEYMERMEEYMEGTENKAKRYVMGMIDIPGF